MNGGCGQETRGRHATSRRQPPDSLMLCNNQSAAWRPHHTKVDENGAAACARRMIAHDVGIGGQDGRRNVRVLRRSCDAAATSPSGYSGTRCMQFFAAGFFQPRLDGATTSCYTRRGSTSRHHRRLYRTLPSSFIWIIATVARLLWSSLDCRYGVASHTPEASPQPTFSNLLLIEPHTHTLIQLITFHTLNSSLTQATYMASG